MDINEIYEASFFGDISRLKDILLKGIDPNIVHPLSGHTPLQVACEADALSAIKILLDYGADPNKRFTKISRIDGRIICSNSVALMHVVSVDAASLLITNGADVALKDDGGNTAIDWAANDKNKSLVAYLKSELDKRTEVDPYVKTATRKKRGGGKT